MKKIIFFTVCVLLFRNQNIQAQIGVITGPTNVCIGNSITLNDTTLGGHWGSNNLLIATVDSLSGNVTGISKGTTIITYHFDTSYVTYNVTVDSIIHISGIIGDSSICRGNTILLTDSVLGGVWSSFNSSIASVDSNGYVTAMSPANDTIYYTMSNSCGSFISKKEILVKVSPPPIALYNNLCVGHTATAVDSVSIINGGVWSEITGKSHIDSFTGVLTGLISGIDQIIFTWNNGCYVTENINIQGVPSAIIVDSLVCIGSSKLFMDSTIGGYWSLSNFTIAHIVGDSIVGVAAGYDTLKYTLYNSCGKPAAVKAIHILQSPAPIILTSVICMNDTMNAYDSTIGGTWSSANGLFSISSSGHINSLSTGHDTIKYILPNGCLATSPVLIDSLPSNVVGDTFMCAGNTITLSGFPLYDSLSSISWTTNNYSAVSLVTAGLVTIHVTGLTSGSVIISYNNICGSTTHRITIDTIPVPSPIFGFDNVCQGSSITLSDSISGGTWRSRFDTVASISGNVVTGLSQGIDLIVYTLTNMCGADSVPFIVFVNPIPIAGTITGTDSLCIGTTTTLRDTSALWDSSSIWSVDNLHLSVISGGEMYGYSVGTDTVVFKVFNSCGVDSVRKVITVKPYPYVANITGTDTLCQGSTVTLSDISSGGNWNTTLGSGILVSASGVVSGVSPGADSVLYSVTNTCGTTTVFTIVTVNPLPIAGIITAPDSICIGSQDYVFESESDGVWSLVNPKLSISGDTITGVSTGMDSVVYTVTNNCGVASVAKAVWVKVLSNPGIIVGTDSVCLGSIITLSDSITGGVWGSSTANASVIGGVVTGDLAGLDTITYIVNYCGISVAQKPIVVMTLPYVSIITGLDTVCAGNSLTLSDSTLGGHWTAFNGNASILGTGILTGNAQGMDTVKYSVTNMCGTWFVTKPVNVYAIPSPGITGVNEICIGTIDTLFGSPTGGAWTTSNINATISGNLLTAISKGIDTIKYAVTNRCGTGFATFKVTIDTNLLPNVTGKIYACIGKIDTLNATPSGGVWSVTDTNASIVSSGSYGGEVTGNAKGMDTIVYSVSNICGISKANFPVMVYTHAECDSIEGVRATNNIDKASLLVYPNPNTGSFELQILAQFNEQAVLEITDVTGKIIFNEKMGLNQGLNNKEIRLSKEIKNGIYFINISIEEKRYITKFVVNR